MKEELREREEALQEAVDAVREGVLVVREDGKICCFNKSFMGMWHVSREVLSGGDARRLLDFIAGQIRDAPEDLTQRTLEATSRVDVGTYRLKDGRAIEVESGPFLRGDRVAGRIWCYRDVSGPARLEEELRRTREEPGLEDAGQPPVAALRPTRWKAGAPALSEREIEVLGLVAQGLTNGGIAGRLGIRLRTVDHHVTHVLTKLNVSNRTAAVVAAQRLGILQDERQETASHRARPTS